MNVVREYKIYLQKVGNQQPYNKEWFGTLRREGLSIDQIIEKGNNYKKRQTKKKEKKILPYKIDYNNSTITINGQEYKYKAFSILDNCIKIYNGNEIIINL